MDTLKAKAIERYENLIAEMQSLRHGIDLLPDGLETLGAYIYGDVRGSIRVDIPMTPTAFEQFRQMLGRNWERNPDGHEYQNDDGYRYFSFRHRASGIELRACFRPDMIGATCQRIQVGSKEVPVFEVICQ